MSKKPRVKIPRDQIYDKYKNAVYKACSVEINNFGGSNGLLKHIEIEDFAQDVWCQIVKHYDRFDPNKSKFTTWMIMITHQIAVQYLKKASAQKRQGILLPLVESLLAEDALDVYKNTDKPKIRKGIIKSTLKKIPSRQHRAVLYLRYFKNLSQEKIAQKYKVSIDYIDQIEQEGLLMMAAALREGNNLDKCLQTQQQ